jgi:acetyl esterase/lipase
MAPVELEARLDAEHRAVLAAMPTDLLTFEDIPAARQRFGELTAQTAALEPLPANVALEDHHTRTADGHDVMVRTYRPASGGRGPALYWIHGGGMILGTVAMNDFSCARTAAELDIVVASVEYRLAPEHPYPTPLEDCYDGLRWFAGAAADLGVEADRIAIGGGSAGGGLAAGLALLARDRGEVPIAFQLLVYPMIDDRAVTASSRAITDPRVWNPHANRVGWNAYLGGQAGTDDVSPYAAPARATDLAGLPPAYIPVGDLDLFLDEDLAYASALSRAGVPVEVHVYPGAFHGSDRFVSRSALATRWVADEHAALRRGLGLDH